MSVGNRIRYLFCGISFFFMGLFISVFVLPIGLFFIAISLWCFYGAFNWKKKAVVVIHKK